MVAAIALLFRVGAAVPASALSLILFLATLAERVVRIKAAHQSSRTQSGGQASDTNMTKEEAYEILDLAPGVSKKEIKQAYHNAIGRNHPDKGGSKYLASKINEAKDILLKHTKE